MALKTFNIDKKTYELYSRHCKKEGISMSKQVEKFIQEEVSKIDKKPTGSITHTIISSDHSMKKYC